MSDSRRAVSPETLERAIRARLVLTHGITSPYVILPLSIHAVTAHEDGGNWELSLDGEDQLADGVEAAMAAADAVAQDFNVSTPSH